MGTVLKLMSIFSSLVAPLSASWPPAGRGPEAVHPGTIRGEKKIKNNIVLTHGTIRGEKNMALLLEHLQC